MWQKDLMHNDFETVTLIFWNFTFKKPSYSYIVFANGP